MRCKKINRKTKIYISCFLTFLSFISITSYFFIAKYITQTFDTSLTKSDNIVFVSDYLKSGDVPIYNVYGNSIDFKLSNYEDENIEISSKDINYNISTTCGDLSKTSGVLKGNNKIDEVITLSNNDLTTCMVTVTSKKPYFKELKATFNFISIDEMTGYKITDKGYYIVLNILTGSILEDITIDYTNFLPDTTNELMSSWTTGSKGVISASKLVKNSNYELRFKKVSSNETYNTNNIKRYSNENI